MTRMPRIAVGTVQADADHRPMTWALMDVLQCSGKQIQSLFAQGRFVPRDAAPRITGQTRRYLDSWSMNRTTCRELFRHGSRDAELALIDGQYDAARGNSHLGRSLDVLCRWLELPQLVILDASRLESRCIPTMPAEVDGLLLDNVRDVRHLCQVQTAVESLYGLPVLGSLPRMDCLRTIACDSSSEDGPSREVCQALGRALESRLQLQRVSDLTWKDATDELAADKSDWQLHLGNVHIAVAFDEAFSCYFADTLDLLESCGATVSVFSPLSSERLPDETDVVYLGCGQPERFAERLTDNFLIKEAICNHVCSGGRVYAEGAGVAYLCHEMATRSGQHWPMVGLLPAVAQFRFRPDAPRPAIIQPLQLTVRRESWLFGRGEQVRGYLNPTWTIRPDGGLHSLVAGEAYRYHMVGDQQVVASCCHLHFASTRMLARFFRKSHRVGLNPVG